MIKFPLFSLKFNLVKLPGLSGPTPPLMPICVAQTHMHTCTHACTWVYTTSLAFIVYGERVFLSSSLESNHQTVNYPYLLIPMLRKKKIPNAVKRKLGIIVYDRNVNFVKKKKNVGFTRCFWSWLPNPFALSTAASPLSDPTPPPMCCLYQSEPNWCLLQALNFRQIK